MQTLTIAFFAAALGLTVTASAASAEIACNAEGDCWHVRDRYEFRPEWGLTTHPDSWRWEEREHARYRWREHDGRGYWHEGRWVEVR